MSLTPDMMPAWELREHLKERDKTITRLRAEVEDLGNRLHHVHRLWANNEHALRAEVERLRAALEAWNSAVRIDVLMEGPRYMGVELTRGRKAWEMTRAALNTQSCKDYEREENKQ